MFFDFDGVIADSEPLHLRAYQTVLGAEGIDLQRDDYYARYLGYDDVGLFQALAKDRGIAVTTEKIDEWVDSKSHIVEQMLSSDDVLFPGAADCVRMFAGARSSRRCVRRPRAGDRHGAQACRAAANVLSPSRRLPTACAASRRPICICWRWPRLRHGSGQTGRSTLSTPRASPSKTRTGVSRPPARPGLRCVAVTNTYPAAELGVADLVVDRLGDLTVSKIEALISSSSL